MPSEYEADRHAVMSVRASPGFDHALREVLSSLEWCAVDGLGRPRTQLGQLQRRDASSAY